MSTAAELFRRWETDPSVAYSAYDDDLCSMASSSSVGFHAGRCRVCGERVRFPVSHVRARHGGSPTGVLLMRFGVPKVLVFDGTGFVRWEDPS